MALVDVSKTITFFQRLCQFAEEFTEEHRAILSDALSDLFQSDLEEGDERPDIQTMIESLLRRLRRTLQNMTQSEIELVASFKENSAFSRLRKRLTAEVREFFDRGRLECRNHFTREKADEAGFPARMAENSSALLRQTKVVSWTLRQPEFDLGEDLIPHSPSSKETILKTFEPKAEELEAAMSDAMRRRARTRGRQVVKNEQLASFRTTYSIFVGLLRGSFRLAGQTELANRLTLNQIGTPSSSPREESPTTGDVSTPADPPSGEPPPSGEAGDGSTEPG